MGNSWIVNNTSQNSRKDLELVTKPKLKFVRKTPGLDLEQER